jgi:hypothetical protein
MILFLIAAGLLSLAVLLRMIEKDLKTKYHYNAIIKTLLVVAVYLVLLAATIGITQNLPPPGKLIITSQGK